MSNTLSISTFRYICLFIGVLSVSIAESHADELEVDFGIDTLHVCMWESVSLSPPVSGGTEPYTFSWSTGDSTESIEVISGMTVQQIILTVIDHENNQASDTLILHGFPECVWPGDANGDGQADNFDLLILGQSYGSNGATRINPHFNWIGQPAPAWGQLLPTGVNFVHSDIDGDGLVDSLDVAGIRHNYFSPQADSGLSPVSASGAPFYLDIPSGTVLPGDTLVIPIMLGTQSNPVDSAYGIGFSIIFDSLQLDSTYFKINVDSSWLGQEGMDMISLHKAFFSEGQIDIAMTRIDHDPISGYGNLGEIIVVIDDLILKKEEIMNVNLEVGHISILNEQGEGIDVLPNSAKIAILLNNEPEFQTSVDITGFPSPADDVLSISVKQLPGSSSSSVSLLDQLGHVMMEKTLIREEEWMWDVSQIPAGIYVLRLTSSGQSIAMKIWIR